MKKEEKQHFYQKSVKNESLSPEMWVNLMHVPFSWVGKALATHQDDPPQCPFSTLAKKKKTERREGRKSKDMGKNLQAGKEPDWEDPGG